MLKCGGHGSSRALFCFYGESAGGYRLRVFVCQAFSRIKVVKLGIWVSDKGGYMIGRQGYGPGGMERQFTRLSGKGRVVDDACYSGDYYVLPFDGNEEEWKAWRRKTGMVNLTAAVFLLGFLPHVLDCVSVPVPVSAAGLFACRCGSIFCDPAQDAACTV